GHNNKRYNDKAQLDQPAIPRRPLCKQGLSGFAVDQLLVTRSHLRISDGPALAFLAYHEVFIGTGIGYPCPRRELEPKLFVPQGRVNRILRDVRGARILQYAVPPLGRDTPLGRNPTMLGIMGVSYIHLKHCASLPSKFQASDCMIPLYVNPDR